MFPPETQQVRSDCSLDERAAKIKGMIAKHHDTIHTTLFQAKMLGEELWQAKDQCISEGKEWYEWLGKQGIEPQWANKRMKIAEYWTDLVAHPSLEKDAGLTEALIIISETAPGVVEQNGEETIKLKKNKQKPAKSEVVNKDFQKLARDLDACKDDYGTEGHRHMRKALNDVFDVWLRWSDQERSEVLEDE